MSQILDCIVIGAGVVGLSCARRFAMAGQEVVILDKADGIGTETSSRNSEVIHAGIYYAPGSLKAKTCVQGKHLLYDYCQTRDIHHKKTGKMIVARDDSQLPALKKIEANALANGVSDLYYLNQTEITRLEPEVKAEIALFSPSTGIIDSHSFMLSLLGEAQSCGAMLAVRSEVVDGKVEEDGIELTVRCEGNSIEQLRAKRVINSAGLMAPKLARTIKGFPLDKIPRDYLCKGHYFTINKRSPFKHLVYPVPHSAGLGVHVTLDLGGNLRFGPDTEWVENINYDVDLNRAESFYAAIREYWPNLEPDSLQPAYSGIRPKIVGPGEPAGDFIIQGPRDHLIPGWVNLFGIESPGLTASLAIADRVYEELSVNNDIPCIA